MKQSDVQNKVVDEKAIILEKEVKADILDKILKHK